MNWLAVLVAEIAAKIIEKLGGDIVDYFKEKERLAVIQQKAYEDAQKSVAALQSAKSGEEIDAATRSSFDGT